MPPSFTLLMQCRDLFSHSPFIYTTNAVGNLFIHFQIIYINNAVRDIFSHVPFIYTTIAVRRSLVMSPLFTLLIQ